MIHSVGRCECFRAFGDRQVIVDSAGDLMHKISRHVTERFQSANDIELHGGWQSGERFRGESRREASQQHGDRLRTFVLQCVGELS